MARTTNEEGRRRHWQSNQDTAAKKTAHATKKAAVKTGDATETAAKDTGKATKTAAKDTGKGTEKVAKKTGEGTEKAADKTADATKTAAKDTGKGVSKGRQGCRQGSEEGRREDRRRNEEVDSLFTTASKPDGRSLPVRLRRCRCNVCQRSAGVPARSLPARRAKGPFLHSHLHSASPLCPRG